jgi:hypothetical protein
MITQKANIPSRFRKNLGCFGDCGMAAIIMHALEKAQEISANFPLTQRKLFSLRVQLPGAFRL